MFPTLPQLRCTMLPRTSTLWEAIMKGPSSVRVRPLLLDASTAEPELDATNDGGDDGDGDDGRDGGGDDGDGDDGDGDGGDEAPVFWVVSRRSSGSSTRIFRTADVLCCLLSPSSYCTVTFIPLPPLSSLI